MSATQASRKKILAVGAAVAVPLAATALYFAVFEPPAPPPPAPPPPALPGKALPADHPPVGGSGTGVAGEQHPQLGGSGRAVEVPPEVKGKWRAVKLKIEARDGAAAPSVVTIALGADHAIAGSRLRVYAREFLPALQVQNAVITSAGNAPTNPAALVSVREGDQEIFKGWLFAKFPEMQPFEHPAYRITLVDGVPAR